MDYQKKLRKLALIISYWSFLGLLATGALPVSIVIFGFVFISLAVFRFGFVSRIPDLVWGGVTIICFIASMSYGMKKNILDAMLFFVIFLLGVKLCGLKKNRDYYHLYAITFFQTVIAAVITPSIIVVFIILGYVFQIIINLVYLNAKYDYERTLKAVGSGSEIKEVEIRRGEGRTVLKLVSLITLMVVLMTAILFTFIPRFPTQVLQGFGGFASLKIQRLSGFSDEINFMNAGEIQSDPSVVMRVQPLLRDGDWRRVSPFYLRATSLNYYSGRKWEKHSITKDDIFTYEDAQVTLPDQIYSRERRLFQKIILEPRGQNYLFAAGYPIRFKMISPRNVEIDEDSCSIRLVKKNETPFIYQTVSVLEPAIKRDPDDPNNEQYYYIATPYDRGNITKMIKNWRTKFINLMLPQGFDKKKYAEFGNSISANQKTQFEKVNAVRNYLATNYKYSLLGENELMKDHLDNFLFKSKQGHCEYFATAMAVILRSMGIPSRVVSGYCTDEWNSIGKYFSVREQNAHTWVEVLFDKYGWMSFDPTPPSGIASGLTGITNLGTFYNMYDSAKFIWYRYVLDYGAEDQLLLRKYLQERTNGVNLKLSSLISSLIKSAGGNLKGNESLNFKAILAFVLIFLVFIYILILLLNELQIFKWKPRLPYVGKTVLKGTSIRFFKDLLRLLKKHGYQRLPSETAFEFTSRIVGDKPALEPIYLIAENYYRVRFNNETLSMDEMENIYKTMSFLKEILKQK